MGKLPKAPIFYSLKWGYGFYLSHGTAVWVTQRASKSRGGALGTTLGKRWLTLPRLPRPERLAPPRASPRIRTRRARRRPPGPPPTPGLRPGPPRAPCGERRPPCARPPARARARRRRGAPWDQPPPSSGPRSLTAEGGAAPPLSDPASPGPNPPETSVRPVLPGPRLRTAGRRSGVSFRAAYAASGWRVASPDQAASLAAATSRLRPAPSRGYPRGRRETPGATNRKAASGPVRPRGGDGDFRVGSPCGTLGTKV